MTVRLLRPTDVVALAAFSGQAAEAELTAHLWPLVEPESPPLSAFSLALGQEGWAGSVHIGTDNGRIAAVALARSRAGGLAWDVERLFAAPDAEPLAVDLLERVVNTAGRRAGRHVFLNSIGQRAQDVARKGGFERYIGATSYVLQPGLQLDLADAYQARPRQRTDDQDLFHLYSAAVPAPVRAAEAMTMEEWLGLHRGRRQWRPTSRPGRRHLVWELGTALVGWAEISAGDHSQYIELLVHPKYEDSTDRLLRYALQQVSPQAPVYVRAREFEVALHSALPRLGFAPLAESDLHVKMLAARVSQPSFVTANVVGG